MGVYRRRKVVGERRPKRGRRRKRVVQTRFRHRMVAAVDRPRSTTNAYVRTHEGLQNRPRRTVRDCAPRKRPTVLSLTNATCVYNVLKCVNEYENTGPSESRGVNRRVSL